jgi:nicotinamide-nucleotide amidase
MPWTSRPLCSALIARSWPSAGVREVLGASVGLSCTGVAGPDPADGQPVGTVFIAVVTPTSQIVHELRLAGSREEIRAATVEGLIRLAETACAA